jgi:hypothetical protein
MNVVVIDGAQQPQQIGRAPRPSSRPPVLTHMTDNAAKNTPQQPPTQSPVLFKRLTPAEMAERRKQGLCYNCDEPYVRGHRCPRLFYLEVTDFVDDEIKGDTDDDQEEQDPVVSLHAITGIRREDTMQLRVVLNDQELLALLDTRAQHITSSTARRHNSVGLLWNPHQGAMSRWKMETQFSARE